MCPVAGNHFAKPEAGEEACETWLKGTSEEAYALVSSFDPEHMRIVQSGTDKKVLAA